MQRTAKSILESSFFMECLLVHFVPTEHLMTIVVSRYGGSIMAASKVFNFIVAL